MVLADRSFYASRLSTIEYRIYNCVSSTTLKATFTRRSVVTVASQPRNFTASHHARPHQQRNQPLPNNPCIRLHATPINKELTNTRILNASALARPLHTIPIIHRTLQITLLSTLRPHPAESPPNALRHRVPVFLHVAPRRRAAAPQTLNPRQPPSTGRRDHVKRHQWHRPEKCRGSEFGPDDAFQLRHLVRECLPHDAAVLLADAAV